MFLQRIFFIIGVLVFWKVGELLTFKIETLGCKVNQYESQLLSEELVEAGFNAVESNPQVIIVNSCTVTGEADNKTLKLIRRLRKENPQCLLVVTGCFPQVNPEAVDIPEVDLVVGGRDKDKVIDCIVKMLAKKEIDPILHTPFRPKEKLWEKGTKGFDGHTRAFMKIQEGCTRYCAYCIIPVARGPLRHKSLAAIKAETQQLIGAGYTEIVFVGINLAMYGEGEEIDLSDAINTAAMVEGDFRLRLGSTEPELMTDALLEKLKACPKFCPSFHLPLQSGCDKTLKEMNRRYTTDEFYQRVLAIRKIFGKSVSISTDIMVGFAGENVEDFLASKTFFEKVGFSDGHIFSYSPRQGTTAANRIDQVETHTKDQRSNTLQGILRQSKTQYSQSRIGSVATVIIEKSQKGGHDQYYSYVSLADEQTLPQGCTVDLEIIGTSQRGLVGKIISNTNISR